MSWKASCTFGLCYVFAVGTARIPKLNRIEIDRDMARKYAFELYSTGIMRSDTAEANTQGTEVKLKIRLLYGTTWR